MEPIDRVVSLILNYLQIEPIAKDYIYNLGQYSCRGEYGVNIGYGLIFSYFCPLIPRTVFVSLNILDNKIDFD